jgi:hypothetical protein
MAAKASKSAQSAPMYVEISSISCILATSRLAQRSRDEVYYLRRETLNGDPA